MNTAQLRCFRNHHFTWIQRRIKRRHQQSRRMLEWGRQITVWAHVRMFGCEYSSLLESFRSLSLCDPHGPTASTPPVQLTLHYCASWVETDTGVLHLWCSPSSASSLWSCDSETQPRGPAASHFTFQGLLWLPRPQTEGHLTPVGAEEGGRGQSSPKITLSTFIFGQQWCRNNRVMLVIVGYILLWNQDVGAIKIL